MSLTIRNLTTIYKSKRQEEVAIEGINLTITKGEFIGVLGRSGAGKSTLIRCINQLVKPTAGEVIWENNDITKLKGKRLRLARREMGMIFQQFHLIPRLTVIQNTLLGLFGYRPYWKNILGLTSKQEKQKAMEALDRVELGHLAFKRVDQLSGGQQQRVAIARVIMQQPRILLGDEPVASLDPVTSKQVMQFIKELHQSEGMTTIINLHDVGLALEFCDRIVGLSKGSVVFDGKPADVNDEVLDKIYV
jgi:phosphonate transport system ATP-binding protein